MIAAKEAPFDVVCIDADKPAYVQYLELSLQLSRRGTLILADNVIRHGSVIDAAPADENTCGVKAFNEAIAAHPRLESIVLGRPAPPRQLSRQDRHSPKSTIGSRSRDLARP